MKAKLTSIGNSTGVILPKSVLTRLGVRRGDVLSLHDTEAGVELTPYDDEFEEDLEIARGVMRRYRNALRELA